MPHNNVRFDVRSVGSDGSTIFIEVKGRVVGADVFMVTFDEVLHGKSSAPNYRLALVNHDQPPTRSATCSIRSPRRAWTPTRRRPWSCGGTASGPEASGRCSHETTVARDRPEEEVRAAMRLHKLWMDQAPHPPKAAVKALLDILTG